MNSRADWLDFDREARELTVKFALHGDGPAAEWAASAQPGQRATIGGPRGSFVIPTDFDWHLLAGDETAVPAITRRLEELPAGTMTALRRVLAEQKGHDRHAIRAAAYWKQGAAAHDENLED